MSDNILQFTGTTTVPIPVEKILEGAKGLKYVLVLGWAEDGTMHAAASESDLGEAVWVATKFIHKVHAGDYETR